MNKPNLPDAVERVLQQFEAMAGAETWILLHDDIRVMEASEAEPRCPLLWMAGFPRWDGKIGCHTDGAARQLGLSGKQAAVIYEAADGYGSEAVRARLLAAAGLA